MQFAQHVRQWMWLAAVIGLIVGIAMTVFFVYVLLLNRFLIWMTGGVPILSLVVGGVVLMSLLILGLDRTDNNGLSYAIQLKHRGAPVDMRTGLTKFFTAGLAISSGLPVGREAPALLLGSSLSTKLCRMFRIDPSELHNAITLGGAAATGALFQAPFGGAIFAAEVPYKEDADEPMIMPAFVASITGALTASTLAFVLSPFILIDLEIFQIGVASLDISFYTTTLAALLGVLGGLIGRVFVLTYDFFESKFKPTGKKSLTLLQGLSTAISLILFSYLVFPQSYLPRGMTPISTTLSFIESSQSHLLIVVLVTMAIQILATSSLLASGFQGGIFGPALRVGILCGVLFSSITGYTDPQSVTAWAIIGMSAVHAATTKTPIASILLILEVTLFPPLIIPMIIANVFAYMVSGPSSLYKGQVRSRETNYARALAEYDQHDGFVVAEVMTPLPKVVSVHPGITVGELRGIIAQSSKREFPVIAGDEVVGMISLDDIRHLGPEKNSECIDRYVNYEFVSVLPSVNGRGALEVMLDADAERVPVIDETGNLQGILSINDIVRGNVRMKELSKLNTVNP